MQYDCRSMLKMVTVCIKLSSKMNSIVQFNSIYFYHTTWIYTNKNEKEPKKNKTYTPIKLFKSESYKLGGIIRATPTRTITRQQFIIF